MLELFLLDDCGEGKQKLKDEMIRDLGLGVPSLLYGYSNAEKVEKASDVETTTSTHMRMVQFCTLSQGKAKGQGADEWAIRGGICRITSKTPLAFARPVLASPFCRAGTVRKGDKGGRSDSLLRG